MALSKGVKGAEEDNVGLRQCPVFLSGIQGSHVGHVLVVPVPPGQVRLAGRLHLNVIECIAVLEIEVQTNALRVRGDLNRMFFPETVFLEPPHLSPEDQFRQVDTKVGVFLHNAGK